MITLLSPPLVNVPTPKHRKPRDEYTEHYEARFRQQQAFAAPRPQQLPYDLFE